MRSSKVLCLLAIQILLFYCLYPYLARLVEFSHPDIVYHYAPFRSWFYSEWWTNGFPFWDPFSGIGRNAEIWTTIPVDVLTPLQFIFGGLEFPEIFALQFVIFVLAAWYAVRNFGLRGGYAVFGVFAFVLAPLTSYFAPYYITVWPFVLYTLAYGLLFRYLTESSRKHLILAWFAILVFGLGGKLEGIFSATVMLGLVCVLYCWMTGQSRKKLLLCLCAIASPLLINFWSYNLVMIAAANSIRVPQDDFSFARMFGSFIEIFRDRNFVAVLGTLASYWCLSFTADKRVRWLFVVTGLVCAALGFAWLPKNRPLFANGCIYALALSFYWRRREPWINNFKTLLASHIVIYLFCGEKPGELQEYTIIDSATNTYQFIIGFFSILGLAGPLRGRRLWFFLPLVCVPFLRTFGVVILSYSVGYIWMPARDNFLFELPVALLACVGLRRFTLFALARIRHTQKARLIYRAAPFVFCALLSGNHARWKWPEAYRNGQLSHEIFSEVQKWEESIPNVIAEGPRRLLTFWHGYTRLANMSNVIEYQSLTSSRYARYSISKRMNLPLESVPNIGTTTGDISAHFERMTRRGVDESSITPVPMSRFNFYYNYIVNAAPPLDCDQLRLLNVRYVEADDGKHTSAETAPVNMMYSLTSPDAPHIAKDVQAKIEACGWPRKHLGNRDFWEIIHPLRRAFVLDGAELEDLAPSQLSKIQILDPDKIKLGNGKVFTIEPVDISAYESNFVMLNADIKKPGYLILTDLYDDHWHARVNGKRTEISPALFLFRAVPVKEPGHIHVEFVFRYPGFILVTVAVVLGLILLGGLIRYSRSQD